MPCMWEAFSIRSSTVGTHKPGVPMGISLSPCERGVPTHYPWNAHPSACAVSSQPGFVFFGPQSVYGTFHLLLPSTGVGELLCFSSVPLFPRLLSRQFCSSVISLSLCVTPCTEASFDCPFLFQTSERKEQSKGQRLTALHE